MYEIGDKVSYGVVGVCEITGIGDPHIKGMKGDFYFMRPVYDAKSEIDVPVKNSDVKMRYILSEKEAAKLVERAVNCKKDNMLNEPIRISEYDEMVKSQEPVQIMHLVRSLFNIKNQRAKDLRKMKVVDSRMLSMARKLLYRELAVSLNKDLEEITEELDGYLSQK